MMFQSEIVHMVVDPYSLSEISHIILPLSCFVRQVIHTPLQERHTHVVYSVPQGSAWPISLAVTIVIRLLIVIAFANVVAPRPRRIQHTERASPTTDGAYHGRDCCKVLGH